MTPVYGASPTKRRTKAEITALRETIWRVVRRDQPMTVRQVFYRLVSLGAIAKTEIEYKATVCRLLAEMRRGRMLPYGWIADNTRWMRKPVTYADLEATLRETARTYRRALWSSQDAYEVDAIAPDDLRDLVRDCITQHINEQELVRAMATEREERSSFIQFIDAWGAAS